MTALALFNNKGGVGKTTLTYHLAHMLARRGRKVLAVDLDPQANLTAAFLDEDDLAVLWSEPRSPAWITSSYHPPLTGMHVTEEEGTVAQAIAPIMEGLGDIRAFPPVPITSGLWLVPGDLGLSAFEDRLSLAWPQSFTGTDPAAVRTTTAFHRIVHTAREAVGAEIVLLDVGPNLGAINRSALLVADAVLVPLAADLFSLRGLRNLGPALREWRGTWQDTIVPRIPRSIDAPRGIMRPLGYVIMQPTMRLDRPVTAYQRWLERIPEVFDRAVLGERADRDASPHHELATLRNYQSLMPLAHDARKPMFDLRSADGAIGSTQTLVQRCFKDYQNLTVEVLDRLHLVEEGFPAG